MTKSKDSPTWWRVEGSLVNLGVVHPVAFFTWNSQSFSERWARRAAAGGLTLIRPVITAFDRNFATRLLYSSLRGITRDRLDALGEEYFHYVIKPRLRLRSINKIKEMQSYGENVVLISHNLEHIIRPLAEHVNVTHLVANRMEFRDGVGTGRVVDPLIRPPGMISSLSHRGFDGTVSEEELRVDLGINDVNGILRKAMIPPKRKVRLPERPVVLFDSVQEPERLSVRENLSGKHILFLGSTGFIGKVWLAHILNDLDPVGKISLLIRGGRSTSAIQRFERMISESPVFEAYHERMGSGLVDFINKHIEVVEGDLTKPNLGLKDDVAARLRASVDLIVNSSGLTDFNPDLRTALSVNVDGTQNLLDFARDCDHVKVVHLSTCYVAGARDGRVRELMEPDYTPIRVAGFSVERELEQLRKQIHEIESRAESDEVTEILRNEILERHTDDPPAGKSFDRLLARRRAKWLRTELTRTGTARATDLGWPNTYCFTKSLGETLVLGNSGNVPYTVIRPAIVETSTRSPFRGWNEGVNTSAPLSHLLGTYFRQLPTNERKCLDIIPVDVVCRGMSLVSAALMQGCHERVYQMATSGIHPCTIQRSIELANLAHRKHYRQQPGFKAWLRSRCDAVPVSMSRYRRFSAPSQKAMVQALNRLTSSLTFKEQTPCLLKTEQNLQRVEKLIELYEPFILHHELIFECENIRVLSASLAPDEQEQFGYDVASDWWEYWINIHIPALRRWSFPLLEGQPPAPARRHEFKLSSSGQDGGQTDRGAASDQTPPKKTTPGASETAWASS